MAITSPSIKRTQVVLCLAGHIDHGKSSLVQALTGGIVDRLPEEQARGMTIDLGFAHADVGDTRFAFIDVPGHERFVHTMLAGASGVDLAVLVVAADDSVMPQTREHLALLQLLGVPRGVVAITKCDLVDAEQLELVRLEIAELVQSTFLAEAPVIEVSSRTGQGVAELRQALSVIAQTLPARQSDERGFRLPIDRVFSPSGTGTVITGTVWSGTARVGDVLHLLPSRTSVRIRRMQSQGSEVDVIAAGERAAINVVGVKASAIRRGDELATPDLFEPARRHLVQLHCLADAERGIKHRDTVRIHLAAHQATALVLMGQKEISPGTTSFAVLQCEIPIVAEYGQPFVVRQLSPARTVGGGTVIGPALRPEDRLIRSLAAASGLADLDPAARLTAYTELRREAEFDLAIESRLGLSRPQCETVAQRLVGQKALVRIDGAPLRYVTIPRFEQLQQLMIARCKDELGRRQPVRQLPAPVLLSAMSREASSPVVSAVLEELIRQGELVRQGDLVSPRVGAALSHRQRKLLDDLQAECREAGRTPPTLKEFCSRHGCTLRDLEPLIEVGVDEGRLDRISPEFVMDHFVLEELRKDLAEYLLSHPEFTISEIREHWQITRKHVIPLIEFFDQQRMTLRKGDVRAAGPRLNVSFDGAAP